MKVIRVLIGIIIILVISMFMSGYRLTPLSAANADNSVTKNHIFIKEYGDDINKYYLYQSDSEKEFLTISIEKKWFAYIGRHSTTIPYSEEKIQTIGGMTNVVSRSGQSSLIIRNISEDVDYIKFETAEGEEKIKVSKESYTYLSIPVNTPTVVIKAFDNSDNNLYYYVFNHDTILSYITWQPVES